MTLELFPSEEFTFASSRKSALDQLNDFVPKAGRYARDRNKVGSIHSSVSRLSPAIRHRLITEDECCEALRKRFADSTIEKFIQEVLDKIARARDLIARTGSQALLEVDGGLKVDNASEVIKAGADVLVAGSAIFNSPNYAETIQAFRTAAHASLPS